ncbi:MAG: nicotinamide phosphoribosyltransferase domain-containing protein, partial [Nanoarchaeota archaeon]
MNPLLLVDSYKVHHTKMYPKGMTKLYSNLTPRKSRIEGVNNVVMFGLQHFILTYLITMFDEKFFGNDYRASRQTDQYFKEDLIEEYKRHCNVDTKHIEALYDLGYLPIEIKA